MSTRQFDLLAHESILKSEAYLNRGIPMLARKHAIEALHRYAQHFDAQTSSKIGTLSMAAGFAAIREAGDFLGRFGRNDERAMQRFIDAHQTPVLKNTNISAISPLQAADAYYEFAHSKFSVFLKRCPNASTALVALAKSEPFASKDDKEIVTGTQLCYLRLAIDCDHHNPSTQLYLGSRLLDSGILEGAKSCLESSYRLQPSAVALNQLANVHRKTGDWDSAKQCEQMVAKSFPAKPKRALVYQVDPQQFAKMSPQTIPKSDNQVIPAAFDAELKVGPDRQDSGNTSDVTAAVQSENWAKRALLQAAKPIRSLLK